ncbi:MAG TPA: colicin transporter [Sphingobium sp.]|nr:colicin transporter [Sphingobium sp.]
MIAIKRLQSIMWILLVATGALLAYLISLRVATERNEVRHLIDQIRWTRSDIRYLEAEFGARASMRQLAAWNQSDLRLYVPAPDQYLPNERALANLDRIAPAGAGYAPPPVMTAMATPTVPTAVAAAASADGENTTPAARENSEFALIRTASAAEPAPGSATVSVPIAAPLTASTTKDVTARASSAEKRAAPVREPVTTDRKTARLAQLDEKLLGGSGAGNSAPGGKVIGSDGKGR